jgi:density-regulated protein DRP1
MSFSPLFVRSESSFFYLSAQAVERPKVTVSNQSRTKKKSVTTVVGLEKFDVKLVDAAKIFRQKFACGASVVDGPLEGEEIQIQGEVVSELVQLMKDKWNVSVKLMKV